MLVKWLPAAPVSPLAVKEGCDWKSTISVAPLSFSFCISLCPPLSVSFTLSRSFFFLSFAFSYSVFISSPLRNYCLTPPQTWSSVHMIKTVLAAIILSLGFVIFRRDYINLQVLLFYKDELAYFYLFELCRDILVGLFRNICCRVVRDSLGIWSNLIRFFEM